MGSAPAAATSLEDLPPASRGRAARLATGFAALAIVSLILATANGAWIVPVAAWIGPPLLLRYLRDRPKWAALASAYPFLVLVWIFQWGGVFRLAGPPFYVGALIFAAIGMLPYVADRLLALRLGGLPSTLLFPAAFVATEMIITMGLPFGLWGSIAYSQAFVPMVAGIAALLGFWGITFLIAWTAAVANFAWERRAAPRRAMPVLLCWAACMALAIAYGAWRDSAPPPARSSLDLAIVLPPVEDNANYDGALAPRIVDHLFAGSSAVARQGARLIAWPEDSFFIPAAGEPALLNRAANFARRSGAWLHMSYGLRVGPDPLRYENRSVLVAPGGERLWTYRKSFPVPGYEARNMVPGDGRVVHIRTPIGNLAGAICFDADHRAIMAQSAADLLILPSDDWPAIEDLHARMVTMRAIEYGIPILRPTINGHSLLIDSRGRRLAQLPVGPGRSIVVRLDSGERPTVYRTLGDWFAWLCLALLAALILLALRRAGPPAQAARPE